MPFMHMSIHLTFGFCWIAWNLCKRYLPKNYTLQILTSFHLLLQLFMYAGFSPMYLEKITSYFNNMANNKLLTIDRLFTIVAFSGNLAATEQIIKVTSSTRQPKKTKQLFHAMLIFNILEAASFHVPNIIPPEHNCPHISNSSLSFRLCLHDPSWSDKVAGGINYGIIDYDFKWTCTFDIFISFYWRHLLETST